LEVAPTKNNNNNYKKKKKKNKMSSDIGSVPDPKIKLCVKKLNPALS